MVREDSSGRRVRLWSLGCVLAQTGVSAAVNPEFSVVPLSMQVSMVVEGFHGNRGLLGSGI